MMKIGCNSFATMTGERGGTMNDRKIENIATVISYIETHLNEKLDLDTVANAVR